LFCVLPSSTLDGMSRADACENSGLHWSFTPVGDPHCGSSVHHLHAIPGPQHILTAYYTMAQALAQQQQYHSYHQRCLQQEHTQPQQQRLLLHGSPYFEVNESAINMRTPTLLLLAQSQSNLLAQAHVSTTSWNPALPMVLHNLTQPDAILAPVTSSGDAIPAEVHQWVRHACQECNQAKFHGKNMKDDLLPAQRPADLAAAAAAAANLEMAAHEVGLSSIVAMHVPYQLELNRV
jgi:hypothetical protein